MCSILLFGWTTALLLLRLGANRPRRRRLWCEPGFLACVTVVFAYAWNAVCIGLLYVALLVKLSPAQLSKVTFSEVARNVTARILSPLLDHAADVGGVILLIWLVTWASGRCRSGSIGLAAPLGPHGWHSRYWPFWQSKRPCSVEDPDSHNHYVMRSGPQDDLAALARILSRTRRRARPTLDLRVDRLRLPSLPILAPVLGSTSSGARFPSVPDKKYEPAKYYENVNAEQIKQPVGLRVRR